MTTVRDLWRSIPCIFGWHNWRSWQVPGGQWRMCDECLKHETTGDSDAKGAATSDGPE